MGWSAGFSISHWEHLRQRDRNPGSSRGRPDAGAIASLPIFPIVGSTSTRRAGNFCRAYARRPRSALRSSTASAAKRGTRADKREPRATGRPSTPPRSLATLAPVTAGLLHVRVIHENRTSLCVVRAVGTTMLLGAVSNALDVPFISQRDPQMVADWHSRSPLEQSSGGVARAALGAPQQSRAVGAGCFGATESALGVPRPSSSRRSKEYREQLGRRCRRPSRYSSPRSRGARREDGSRHSPRPDRAEPRPWLRGARQRRRTRRERRRARGNPTRLLRLHRAPAISPRSPRCSRRAAHCEDLATRGGPAGGRGRRRSQRRREANSERRVVIGPRALAGRASPVNSTSALRSSSTRSRGSRKPASTLP